MRPTGLELRLPYRTPFDWTSLIAFLKERAIDGVELVTEDCYRRTIEVGGVGGLLTVRQDEPGAKLVVTLETGSYEGLAHTVERIRRIFDLGADPIQIAAHLSRDPGLSRLLKARPGLRLPGVWDGFEAAAMAILGQGLTARGRARSIAQLVRSFGKHIPASPPGLQYLFPRPEALAAADLSKAGIGEAAAKQLHRLAKAVVSGVLSFQTPRTLEQSIAELQSACGVDESTAHGIAMRAFGEPDAFPYRDPGLRRKLARSAAMVSPGRALARAETWRPWRAYAALHITHE